VSKPGQRGSSPTPSDITSTGLSCIPMQAVHGSALEDAGVCFGRAAPLVGGAAVWSSAAFGSALLEVAGKAGTLEVVEAVVVAGLAVVGFGTRRATADNAEAAGRVALEDDSAALAPVGREAGASRATRPSAHPAIPCSAPVCWDNSPTSSRTVHHLTDSRAPCPPSARTMMRFVRG
jgi:hypothetical protein